MEAVLRTLDVSGEHLTPGFLASGIGADRLYVGFGWSLEQTERPAEARERAQLIQSNPGREYSFRTRPAPKEPNHAPHVKKSRQKLRPIHEVSWYFAPIMQKPPNSRNSYNKNPHINKQKQAPGTDTGSAPWPPKAQFAAVAKSPLKKPILRHLPLCMPPLSAKRQTQTPSHN